MNTQFTLFHGGTFQLRSGAPRELDAIGGELHRLQAGKALRLDRNGGELTVLDARVWLTRDGEPGDHFVEPGQSLHLGMDENAVIEAARPGQDVTLRWKPQGQRSAAGAVFVEPLRFVARVARLAAAGFAALARSAAASARRAQGCISDTDSMASSGALK